MLKKTNKLHTEQGRSAWSYTEYTQTNGAVSMVNKGKQHHSFVYTLYKYVSSPELLNDNQLNFVIRDNKFITSMLHEYQIELRPFYQNLFIIQIMTRDKIQTSLRFHAKRF
jgi:hypothetical protein